MVWGQDPEIGRQAWTNDTEETTLMDICLLELEHFRPLRCVPQNRGRHLDYLEQMRHESDLMALDELAGFVEEEHEGEREQVHAVGRAEGEGKAKGKGKPKAPTNRNGKATDQPGGKRAQNGTWGHEDPHCFPYNFNNCGERSHEAMHCVRARGEGRGKQGFYRVGGETSEITESQDLGDQELCGAVEEVWETGAGQASSILSDDPFPGLIDPVSFDPWHLYLGPTSGRDLEVDHINPDAL